MSHVGLLLVIHRLISPDCPTASNASLVAKDGHLFLGCFLDCQTYCFVRVVASVRRSTEIKVQLAECRPWCCQQLKFR